MYRIYMNVWDSPTYMCTICMTALRFAHILYVQDMLECLRHADKTTNLLYTQYRRSTVIRDVGSYLYSLLKGNGMKTGATSTYTHIYIHTYIHVHTYIPVNTALHKNQPTSENHHRRYKSSGMLRRVAWRTITDFSKRRNDVIITVKQSSSPSKVLESYETSSTICQYKRLTTTKTWIGRKTKSELKQHYDVSKTSRQLS